MASDPSIPGRPIRILLLEDSDMDAELLAAHLDKARIAFEAKRVMRRADFVAALEEGGWDIILADYSLPEFDGLSALTIARAMQPDIPFLFVSGVVGEEFATNALKRGATDYVMKRNLSRLPTALERALEQAQDRVERRRTEEALRHSEMSARLATEAAHLGIWDLELRTGRFTCDERCRSLFGLVSTAGGGREALLTGCHPDDRARMERAIERAIDPTVEQGGHFGEQYRIILPDGRERWVATHGQAIFESDICVRFLGAVRDITEEKRASEALRDLATALEQQVAERTAERDRIWRLSADLFSVIGFDGRLRRLNPAWQQMLGYDADRLVGSSISLLIHPDDRDGLENAVRQLSAGRKVDRLETRLRHLDGSWRWISWTAAPEGDAFYAVGRDVTSEKQASASLAERNRELANQIEERERVEYTLRQMQRLEAVGQLTAGVAHDFNNLLTVILGNIGFVERSLERLGIQDRALERLGHMRMAAERGAKLTAQLLAFSRRQKLEPKPVDLNETVSGMRDLLQSTMGGSVQLKTNLNPGLWPALVDPTQIELIILNLAINARDAMDVGGMLTVETFNIRHAKQPRRPEEPSPGDYVVLAVSDTGSGMNEEVLAKAFEPFFTTKEIGKGSGLGLPQVYGFAKQSGGGVSIDTRLGEGTTIRVYLPRAAGTAQQPGGQEPATAPEPGRDDHIVLLVDDDAAVRDVTASMLRDLGYHVIDAGNGSSALELLRSGQAVDLLLVDYAMPGMNGAELARAAGQLRPGLPTVFITGYADLKALREIGEERVVRKPFQDNELQLRLAGALSHRPSNVVRFQRS
ncbi:response regulator [Ancylobacter sp. 6x-1]|uniref:histidine kinase n=1 Tax=Ancylobacter crimeensis TaxID=2579147 RepID=A0ABT0D8D9_9HYPH|nr:response regulator [Ancylobacter crimeensis]MCK0196230.1 response regulator [Ancylobacter crimeensis]